MAIGKYLGDTVQLRTERTRNGAQNTTNAVLIVNKYLGASCFRDKKTKRKHVESETTQMPFRRRFRPSTDSLDFEIGAKQYAKVRANMTHTERCATVEFRSRPRDA